jgi:pSer/pThr/pTyr-binding forkhead associated (FHA) protein
MAKLTILMPGGPETVHELTEDLVTLGRASDNVIVLDDGSASGHHAQLKLAGGVYHLKDLGSTNGTRVNGNPTSEARLRDGDKLRFGGVEAVFRSDQPAGAQPLPEADQPVLAAAESSHRPDDFADASPFPRKRKQKDPLGAAVLAFFVLALLVFGFAVSQVLLLQPPQ